MKVMLLNNGGYAGFKDIVFPVEVEAYQEYVGSDLVRVPESELKRIGCFMGVLNDSSDPFWPFSLSLGECEVIK